MSAPVLVNALSRRPRGLHVPSRDSSSSPEEGDADGLGAAHPRAASAGAASITRRTILRRDAHSQPSSAVALRIADATAGGIATVSGAGEADAGADVSAPARSVSAGPVKRVTWASARRSSLPSNPSAEAAPAVVVERPPSPLEATAASLMAAPAAATAPEAAASSSTDGTPAFKGAGAVPANAARVPVTAAAAAAPSDSRAARLARHGPFLQMQPAPAQPTVPRPSIATVARPLARKKKPGSNRIAPLTAAAPTTAVALGSSAAPASAVDPEEADRAISAAVTTAASLVVGFFGGMLSAITEAVDDEGTGATSGPRVRSNKIAPIPLPATGAAGSSDAGAAASSHVTPTGQSRPDIAAAVSVPANSGSGGEAPTVGLGKDASDEAAEADADAPGGATAVPASAAAAELAIVAAPKDDAVSPLPAAASSAAAPPVDNASGWMSWLAGAGGVLAAAGSAAASAVSKRFASDPTHSSVVAPLSVPVRISHDIHRDFTTDTQYATDEDDSEPDDFERTSSRNAAREVAAMRAAGIMGHADGGMATSEPAGGTGAATGTATTVTAQSSPTESRPTAKRSTAPTTLCEMCAMGEGGTAILMHACMNDHVRCMASLLAPLAAKRRAEVVDGRDRLGRTAYHIAAAFDRPDAVAVLTAVSTARVNALDESLHTPLHYAALYGYAAVAGALVRRADADISIPDARGNNVLHLCASTGEHTVMAAALGATNAAAAVAARNQLGHTPLHLCTNSLCVMLLMRSGAPLWSPDTQGLHPLHGIASRADEATVGAFMDGCLAAGVDVRDVVDVPAENGSGLTPLMVAAFNGNSSTADGLLVHGAAATATDAAGRTPAALAVLNNHDALGGKLLRWEITQRQHAPPATTSARVTVAHEDATAEPAEAASLAHQHSAAAVGASASAAGASPLPDAAPRAPPAGRRRIKADAAAADAVGVDHDAVVDSSTAAPLPAGAHSLVAEDGRPIVAIVDVDSSRLPSDDELSGDSDVDGSDAAGGSAYRRKKVKDAPLRRHGRRRENYLAMVQAHAAEQPYKDAAHGRVEPPKCVLCHEVRVTRAFLPCEHACACDPCIARLELGPPIARMRHMSAAGKEVSRITAADVIKTATGGAGTSAAVAADSGGAAPAGAAMYWDMCPVCVAQIVSIVPIGELNGDHAKKVMAAALPLMVGGSVQPVSTDFARLFAVSGKKLRKWVHARQTTGKWSGPPTRSLSGIVDAEMRAEAAAAGGTFCL